MPALRLSGLATVAALSFTSIPWYAGAQDLTTFQEGVSPTVGYAQDATYIRSGSGDGNFDDDTDLELIVGTTTSDDVGLRSLLEFDISEIPASSQVGLSVAGAKDPHEHGTRPRRSGRQSHLQCLRLRVRHRRIGLNME